MRKAQFSPPIKNAAHARTTERESPRPLLTVKEVALLDGCSEKTVRRAISAGLLEATRIGAGGRLIRIHPDALETYRKMRRLWSNVANNVQSNQ